MSNLGEFLRAHRARIDPTDLGLPRGHDRRVRGLRREEVAALSGVSADYYARLEQGRERRPSSQVIDAIARVLRLDHDALAHLYRLAGLDPGRPQRGAEVHPALLRLLDSFPGSACYVLGPAFDVLATNTLAAALLEPFAGMTNMVRILFRHPQAHAVFVEWPVLAESTVAALRFHDALYPDYPAISALVAELRRDSPEFRALWADHTVRGLTRHFKVFQHPAAGRVELVYQTFDVRDAPGQQLLVGTPEPGSRSAEALAYLSAMHPAA
jgi:transcriptional regulator with XRE-family HTH domain